MKLICPRCSTYVPEDALYCPYCTLPKPKTGFPSASQEEGQPRNVAPRRKAAANEPRPATRSLTARQKRHPVRSLISTRVPRLALIVLVAALGTGAYAYFSPLARSNEPEPKAVLTALDTLRQMPSKEEGLTIDGWLNRELEKCRRVGNLVAYQGWTVKRVEGTGRLVRLIFSYEEVGNLRQQAEWLVDLGENSFTPQNELAVSISK
jgi:hypothetical protein